MDTNILAYAEGVDDAQRQAISRQLMQRLPEEIVLIPVQAIGELYNVLVRKAGWSGDRARGSTAAWRDGFALAPTTETALIAAIDLAAGHRLSIWDSIMISVAAENGCRLLLSENLQDGFSWRGVTVANPFAANLHPLLDALLAEAGKG